MASHCCFRGIILCCAMVLISSFRTHVFKFQRSLEQNQRCSKYFLSTRCLSSISTLSSSLSSDTTGSAISDEQEQRPSSSPSPRNRLQVGRPSSNTGGLRRLPVVNGPNELVNKARKIARFVKPDADLKNVRNRARKHGAETLNALMQALCIPLRDTVNGYKAEWRRLHPFERVVADLTIRAREKKDGLTLESVLDQIHEARKLILETGKDWIYKVKNAETAREAGEGLNDGIESLIGLFNELAGPPVSGLIEVQKSLRSAPIVKLDSPAVVLVGAPNVGKSSIVRAISSANPEVNNYPFTTRGMTLGHVEVFWAEDSTVARAVVPKDDKAARKNRKSDTSGRYAYSHLCQIMDSPGLLVRDNEEDRNEMEALTMAAMQHLPTAVMYVLDLTGQAGDKCSSISDQLILRKQVRSRFPRRPWIDVLSKVDLGISVSDLKDLEEVLDGEPYIKLSIHEGDGVDDLKYEVVRMLGEVKVVLNAMVAMESQNTMNKTP